MNNLIRYRNGLTVVYKYVPTVRSVAIGVFAKVGSVNENPRSNGISHFIEHMTFKGTEKRTAFDIVAESDNIGANINAFTSKTATCYYTVCVDNDVEKCADILSDIYFNSVYPEEEIEKEKGVVLEEIAMSIDTPDDLCAETGAGAFYKGHPLARPILGSRKNVSGFSREDIFEFRQKHYTSNNTYISIVGNIEYDKVCELIDKYFTEQFKFIKAHQKRVLKAEGQLASVKKFKKIEQSHLAFYFPSVCYADKRAHAVRVFNTAFGYGMSSRLFQNIREKLGLAYSVYSYPSFYPENGNLMIYLATNAKSVRKAVEAVRQEIDNVVANGLTKDEFLRGKAQMKSSVVFGQESTSNIMTSLGRHATMTNEYFDFDRLLDKIERVTLDEVNEVVKHIFDFDRVAASYVGPRCETDILNTLRG